MDVDEQKALAAGRPATHEGHAYCFCSDECKTTFEKAPTQDIK